MFLRSHQVQTEPREQNYRFKNSVTKTVVQKEMEMSMMQVLFPAIRQGIPRLFLKKKLNHSKISFHINFAKHFFQLLIVHRNQLQDAWLFSQFTCAWLCWPLFIQVSSTRNNVNFVNTIECFAMNTKLTMFPTLASTSLAAKNIFWPILPIFSIRLPILYRSSHSILCRAEVPEAVQLIGWGCCWYKVSTYCGVFQCHIYSATGYLQFTQFMFDIWRMLPLSSVGWSPNIF